MEDVTQIRGGPGPQVVLVTWRKKPLRKPLRKSEGVTEPRLILVT